MLSQELLKVCRINVAFRREQMVVKALHGQYTELEVRGTVYGIRKISMLSPELYGGGVRHRDRTLSDQ